jgi:hypothetical protein
MTLLEPDAPESLQGPPVPVLETERLVLRAPRFDDAATIAALVNDRRIAENTLRIPHPYTLADAQAFLTAANVGGGEIVFLITSWNGTVLGCCGIGKRDGEHPEIGYWLGVPFWGTRPDRSCLRRSRLRRAGQRRAGEQPRLAPGAAEVRFRMDRRRPLPHPRARLVGAGRSLPSRPRSLGVPQELGQRRFG